MNKFLLTLIVSLAFCALTIGSVEAESAKLDQGTYKDLIAGYKLAHKTKDTSKLKGLFCLDRVPEALFPRILNHLEKGFSRSIETVTVTEIDKDWPMSYEMGGVTYSPNLKPEAQLLIQFVTGSGIQHTKLLIGEKNGEKVLITSVPEEK